jgi:hypothetical protein
MRPTEQVLKQDRSHETIFRDGRSCPETEAPTCFAEPIDLPNGVKLASLRDAIVRLVNTVPSSDRGTPVIHTAAELLTSAAERGSPIEFAHRDSAGAQSATSKPSDARRFLDDTRWAP